MFTEIVTDVMRQWLFIKYSLELCCRLTRLWTDSADLRVLTPVKDQFTRGSTSMCEWITENKKQSSCCIHQVISDGTW